MDLPVRMVCGGCLRSVEVVPANGNAGGNPCPYCGEPIESREDDRDPGMRMTRVAADVAEARPGRSGAMPDWASTWSLGSFGSLGRFQLRERLGDGVSGTCSSPMTPGSTGTWPSRSSSSLIRASG